MFAAEDLHVFHWSYIELNVFKELPKSANAEQDEFSEKETHISFWSDPSLGRNTCYSGRVFAVFFIFYVIIFAVYLNP